MRTSGAFTDEEEKEDKRCTLRINKPALNTGVAYMPPLEVYRTGRQAVHNAAQLKRPGDAHVKGDVFLFYCCGPSFVLPREDSWLLGPYGPRERSCFIPIGRCELTLGRGFRGDFRLRRIHHRGTSYYRPSSFSLHFRDSLPRLSGLSEISVWSLDRKGRAG